MWTISIHAWDPWIGYTKAISTVVRAITTACINPITAASPVTASCTTVNHTTINHTIISHTIISHITTACRIWRVCRIGTAITTIEAACRIRVHITVSRINIIGTACHITVCRIKTTCFTAIRASSRITAFRATCPTITRAIITHTETIYITVVVSASYVTAACRTTAVRYVIVNLITAITAITTVSDRYESRSSIHTVYSTILCYDTQYYDPTFYTLIAYEDLFYACWNWLTSCVTKTVLMMFAKDFMRMLQGCVRSRGFRLVCLIIVDRCDLKAFSSSYMWLNVLVGLYRSCSRLHRIIILFYPHERFVPSVISLWVHMRHVHGPFLIIPSWNAHHDFVIKSQPLSVAHEHAVYVWLWGNQEVETSCPSHCLSGAETWILRLTPCSVLILPKETSRLLRLTIWTGHIIDVYWRLGTQLIIDASCSAVPCYLWTMHGSPYGDLLHLQGEGGAEQHIRVLEYPGELGN